MHDSVLHASIMPFETALLVVKGLELQSFSYHPAFFSRCWTCLLSLPAVLISV